MNKLIEIKAFAFPPQVKLLEAFDMMSERIYVRIPYGCIWALLKENLYFPI